VVKTIHTEESPSINGGKPTDDFSSTLGDRAYSIIHKQFHRLTKHESGVLDDRDPEDLHQMRVSARRLQAALQAFGDIVDLPKAAQLKQVRSLAKALGKLRDLDVQMAALQNYSEGLDEREQAIAQTLMEKLLRDRTKAFRQVHRSLTHNNNLKTAYQEWLEQPQYTALAQMPLKLAIADLINPLLSAFLLHPGWLTQDLTDSSALHDLRKLCKAVRYQAEFLADCYPQPFQEWIDELKAVQEHLGVVQDGAVLLEMLPQKEKLPELKAAIRQEQMRALDGWKPLRDQYLSHDFRQRLRAIVNQDS
jgi:CHAD domain-containing protein